METVKDYIDNSATLPLILEWAEEIFGEDNVEFQLEKNIENDYIEDYSNEDFIGHIYIYIPEKPVTNEEGFCHKIFSCYIKIDVKKDFRVGGFNFTRSSISNREANKGYLFSHCSAISVNAVRHAQADNLYYDLWRSPCLGTGPIVTSLSRLQVTFSEENWKIFLNDLDSYFEVESITGVPYIYMGSLYNNGNSNSSVNLGAQYTDIDNNREVTKTFLREFCEYLMHEDWYKEFSYNTSSGKIEATVTDLIDCYLKTTKMLEDFIDITIAKDAEYGNLYKQYLIPYNSICGTALIYQRTPSDSNYSDIHYDMGFTFKGNNVIFTVVPEPEPLNDDRKLGIDPNIFNILIYIFTKVALFINSNTYYVDTDIKRIFV